jgi:hypothetical protein
MSDMDLFSQFFVAEQLGKTMAEMENMSMSEFSYWIAYFKIQNEKHKK